MMASPLRKVQKALRLFDVVKQELAAAISATMIRHEKVLSQISLLESESEECNRALIQANKALQGIDRLLNGG